MDDKTLNKTIKYVSIGIVVVLVAALIVAFFFGKDAANKGYQAQDAQASASASANKSTPAPQRTGSTPATGEDTPAPTSTQTQKDGMDDITSGKLDKAEQGLGRFTGVPEKVTNNLTAFSDTFTTVTDMDQLIGVKGQTFNPKQCDYTTKNYLVCSSVNKEYAVILNPNNMIPVGVVNLKNESFSIEQVEKFSKISQHGAQQTFLTGTWGGKYVLLAGDLNGLNFLG